MSTEKPDFPTVDYTKKAPPNPWEHGWRSWLILGIGECIGQIIVAIIAIILALAIVHFTR